MRWPKRLFVGLLLALMLTMSLAAPAHAWIMLIDENSCAFSPTGDDWYPCWFHF